MISTLFLAVLASTSTVSAHMSLSYPIALRDKANPNSVQANIDYSITTPLAADGSNFPCKGYQSDMGTPAGTPVATWAAGGAYNFTIQGGATHSGGSCQASLSYDKGVSFTTIHSYIGNCPTADGESFDFTMPADAPAGTALFAWTWMNEVGNREFYMSCSSVAVTAASKRATPAVAFAKRPSIFLANLANGCTTVSGTDVVFPDPGPAADITTKKTDSNTYTGTCAQVKGIGAESASGDSGASGPAASGSSVASVASSTPAATVTQAASATTPIASSIATSVSSAISLTIIPSASASASASASGFSTVPLSSAAAATPIASSTPSTTASGPTASGTGVSTVSGEQTPGSKCTSEGMFNCISGTSFQQCASGQWSVVQAVAPGTGCTAGQSMTMSVDAAVARRNIRGVTWAR